MWSSKKLLGSKVKADPVRRFPCGWLNSLWVLWFPPSPNQQAEILFPGSQSTTETVDSIDFLGFIPV